MFKLKFDEKSVFVNFKVKEFSFDGKACKMIIIQDKTSQIAFDKLKYNNDMIKMQASCVSHDMRAPLSAITYVVDSVIKKTKNEKKIRMLKPVRCAAKILSVQIFNLLDYNLL
jgi:K+-sensing histidine kinase KdpD